MLGGKELTWENPKKITMIVWIVMYKGRHEEE
jgi:hypothetical protein